MKRAKSYVAMTDGPRAKDQSHPCNMLFSELHFVNGCKSLGICGSRASFIPG